MRIDVKMPALGYDMQTGVVKEWLKKIGDSVDRGEAIAVIETDKADVEMEATQSGMLVDTVVDTGTAVPVGEVIAYMETE